MDEPIEPRATPSNDPQPDHRRTLADSSFPDDAGLADPDVRRALAAVGNEPSAYLDAVAALGGARLLVPVVATATKLATVPGTDGRIVSDKEAEMAVVLLRAGDGRQALLAFTGNDSLTTWDAAARPVPVTLDLAARATVDEGAAALLVDVAGPSSLAIDGDVLVQLARGHRLVKLPDGYGWMMPAPIDAAPDSDDVRRARGRW
ncbi:MAG: SseB family protein [Propionibacteriaceae bacterium]